MDVARMARYLSAEPDDVTLVAMTDPARFPDPAQALAALPKGAALIWRAYDTDLAGLQRLAALANAKSCLLLVAGHPRLSRRLRAPGLHLPERSLFRHYENGYLLPLHERPPGLAVTAACHSERAIRAAARAGADAVLISPVLPTASHDGVAHLGIVRFVGLSRLARSLGLAPYALGGITTVENIRRLRGTGAAGIAGVGFLLSRQA